MSNPEKKRITITSPFVLQSLFSDRNRFLEIALVYKASKYERRKNGVVLYSRNLFLDVKTLDRIDFFIERENKGKSFRKRPIKSWSQALRVIIDEGLKALGIPQ